jgi:LuxR family maltose regulon positive regulatory protein
MGLVLTAQDVATLEGRTEGWIAALQLAALSMQGRDDVAGFIAGFAGDDRYIVDYLAEEVLQRQPEHVRHFLLRTSILDRLSGPLCDAVTGHDGGNAKLAALEQGNLFLVPLDDRRQWYRYHQLFADVLQAHLLDEQRDDVPELHERASIWYEQNGDESEAIDHALAAEDFERAADLVELAIPRLRRDRREATLRSWLKVIPDELLRARPVLNIGFVGRWWLAVSWRALRTGCGTPSAGWRKGQLAVRDRKPHQARWSCSTWRNFRAFWARSRCIVPRWLWSGVMGPAR